MMGHGFSHIGVSTHDMDATIHFYDTILGFRRVVDSVTHVSQGGTLREVYFDVGAGQYMVFMDPKNVPRIPNDYDTGINAALGVPGGMYHFSFRSASLDELEEKRRLLQSHGIAVSAVIDLEAGKSIFFNDPNGLQLEFAFSIRPFNEADLARRVEASVASPA
jgi:catechol 2,3-dioxygenase-like lactoylglutathione lyase family enzyme